jgi:hypothetical protein
MEMETFKAIYKGEEKEFKIRLPGVTDVEESQKIFNRYFKSCLNSGAILREKLEDLMREQGLWDDSKQQLLIEMQNELRDINYKLKKGGITLSAGKALALRMIDIRDDISSLLSKKSQLDSLTAQGQAENYKFQYLVSACVVYSDGSKVFTSLDDYLNNNTEPAAYIGAQKLAEAMTGFNADESTLPEYQFLKKYKFVDEKLRLVNKEGQLIDRDGRRIDENGRFVDKDGKFIDKDGHPVDEEGEYIIEFVEFTDDIGNCTEEVEAPTKKKKKEKVVETEEVSTG